MQGVAGTLIGRKDPSTVVYGGRFAGSVARREPDTESRGEEPPCRASTLEHRMRTGRERVIPAKGGASGLKYG